jgi:hypothetical protein
MEPTPEDAVRDHVPGVLADDEVLPSAYGPYPFGGDSAVAWIIVRRDGEVIARFSVNMHEERWGVHWGYTCPGHGITHSDEPENGATLGQ